MNFIEILNTFCICIIGIITSAALIYKIDFRMILLILATCVAEAAALHLLNKAELKTGDKQSKVLTKFNYFYNLSKNTSVGKDIALYSFGDRFIAAMAGLVLK